MNWQGWLCLLIAIASVVGIFYIDHRYQERDRAEMRENAQRAHDDGDWFV